MATSYTLNNVNGKVGSIVLTPSTSPANPNSLPEYFFNIKSAKLRGNNPFLADGVTNNPNATVSLFYQDGGGQYLFKDIPISAFTSIGGVGTPASLTGVLTAIANLIAE